MNISIRTFIKRNRVEGEAVEMVNVDLTDEFIATMLLKYLRNSYGVGTTLEDYEIKSVELD